MGRVFTFETIKNQIGISLVELLAGVAIASIVVTSSGYVIFQVNKETFSTSWQEELNREHLVTIQRVKSSERLAQLLNLNAPVAQKCFAKKSKDANCNTVKVGEFAVLNDPDLNCRGNPAHCAYNKVVKYKINCDSTSCDGISLSVETTLNPIFAETKKVKANPRQTSIYVPGNLFASRKQLDFQCADQNIVSTVSFENLSADCKPFQGARKCASNGDPLQNFGNAGDNATCPEMQRSSCNQFGFSQLGVFSGQESCNSGGIASADVPPLAGGSTPPAGPTGDDTCQGAGCVSCVTLGNCSRACTPGVDCPMVCPDPNAIAYKDSFPSNMAKVPNTDNCYCKETLETMKWFEGKCYNRPVVRSISVDPVEFQDRGKIATYSWDTQYGKKMWGFSRNKGCTYMQPKRDASGQQVLNAQGDPVLEKAIPDGVRLWTYPYDSDVHPQTSGKGMTYGTVMKGSKAWTVDVDDKSKGLLNGCIIEKFIVVFNNDTDILDSLASVGIPIPAGATPKTLLYDEDSGTITNPSNLNRLFDNASVSVPESSSPSRTLSEAPSGVDSQIPTRPVHSFAKTLQVSNDQCLPGTVKYTGGDRGLVEGQKYAGLAPNGCQCANDTQVWDARVQKCVDCALNANTIYSNTRDNLGNGCFCEANFKMLVPQDNPKYGATCVPKETSCPAGTSKTGMGNPIDAGVPAGPTEEANELTQAIYRYVSYDGKFTHRYSLNPNDTYMSYKNEGIKFYLYKKQEPNTLPIYRCKYTDKKFSGYRYNLSTDPNCAFGSQTPDSPNLLGYAYSGPGNGGYKMYCYTNVRLSYQRMDILYTLDSSEQSIVRIGIKDSSDFQICDFGIYTPSGVKTVEATPGTPVAACRCLNDGEFYQGGACQKPVVVETIPTVPVYRFVSRDGKYIHRFSLDPNDGAYGYQSEGVKFYLFKDQQPNTVPIYRCWIDDMGSGNKKKFGRRFLLGTDSTCYSRTQTNHGREEPALLGYGYSDTYGAAHNIGNKVYAWYNGRLSYGKVDFFYTTDPNERSVMLLGTRSDDIIDPIPAPFYTVDMVQTVASGSTGATGGSRPGVEKPASTTSDTSTPTATNNPQAGGTNSGAGSDSDPLGTCTYNDAYDYMTGSSWPMTAMTTESECVSGYYGYWTVYKPVTQSTTPSTTPTTQTRQPSSGGMTSVCIVYLGPDMPTNNLGYMTEEECQNKGGYWGGVIPDIDLRGLGI